MFTSALNFLKEVFGGILNLLDGLNLDYVSLLMPVLTFLTILGIKRTVSH